MYESILSRGPSGLLIHPEHAHGQKRDCPLALSRTSGEATERLRYYEGKERFLEEDFVKERCHGCKGQVY